jgi:hypothetical protein
MCFRTAFWHTKEIRHFRPLNKIHKPILNAVCRARLLVSFSQTSFVVNVEDRQVRGDCLIGSQERPVEGHRLVCAAALHVVANERAKGAVQQLPGKHFIFGNHGARVKGVAIAVADSVVQVGVHPSWVPVAGSETLASSNGAVP